VGEERAGNVAARENASRERWLFSILGAIYDGVMVVDARGTIVYANPAYTRIFGVPVEKVLGRRLAEIEPASRVLEVLRTGKPLIDDPAYVVSAGVDIVTNITPIYESGTLAGAVAIFRDQSEILSLQEKLKTILGEVEKTRNLASRYFTELQELRARFLDIGDLIFSSRQMQKIIELVLQLANVDSTVLITGESGVGKEIIAKLIHRTSRRSKEAFVTVNCGAIPENLLESELFGYERGSFTGASREGKPGLLEVANHGTIFLDEIGELPLILQVKLLRVIQEQKVMRIGGLKPVELNVRFLAATNRDLKEMVANRTFRHDLFYRLNVVSIHIPPLRERRRDIVPLTRLFLDKYNRRYGLQKKLVPGVYRCFEQYAWPGNVRELENLVERLVVCTKNEVITLDDEHLARYLNPVEKEEAVVVNEVLPLKKAREMVEKNLLARALTLGGTSRAAAKILAVDHSTVVRKARRYHLNLVEQCTGLVQDDR